MSIAATNFTVQFHFVTSEVKWNWAIPFNKLQSFEAFHSKFPTHLQWITLVLQHYYFSFDVSRVRKDTKVKVVRQTTSSSIP